MAVQTWRLRINIAPTYSMNEPIILSDEMHRELDHDPFLEWCTSVTIDYMHKLTFVGVLLFVSYPWVALYWPPYYLMRRWSK